MMDFLTLTFGNIIGFSNWASKLTKFGAVSQLEDVFYNSFQTCLKEANAKTKGEDEIALNQIELLLRWERKKVISIFKSNALQEISDFRQAMTKSDFIDLLIDNLLKIIEEENSQTIDKVLARKLITNAVENYQNTLFNQISEKQGIYIVLHQVFESQETIEQILINIKRQDEKLDRVHSEVIMDGNSTRIMIDEGFQGIRSMLTDRGMQLESRDWVRKEVLVVEHQKRIEEAILLLKKQDYHESEKTFTNLKEKLILQKLDIENLLYTVNINLGESQERLGKFGMAAKNYIEAYTYNPDSPRAIYLAYIGYKMLNKNDEAEELSQKLKQNYHIELETFVVRLNEKSCIIENIVANLPTTFIGNPELNYAIAKAHLRKGNIKKYKEYMLKAISYSSDNGLLYKPILAYNISHASSSRFHSVKENYLSKAERENLRLAIRLYKEVWEVHRKTKLSKDFIGMPINISTIYSALGMYQKAIEWIDIVLGIKNTAALKSQKIYFLKKWGKKKSVIQICREIDDFAHPDYHDALMIFVEALFNTGIEENQQEAILRLEQFVKKYPDSELINRAKHFLANLYLSTDNLGEMENLLEREPNSISIIALKGRLAFAKKEFERIDKYAEEALNLIDKNTTDTELSELAIALMESQKFTDAAEIFEKFLSPAEPTYLSDCLIHCYKESGNFDKVITHCKQSYETIGINIDLSKELINAYIYIKDYQSAFDLMEEYCNTFHDELEMLLRLGELTFYLKKDTEDILSRVQEIPFTQLSVYSIQRIAAMLLRVGKRMETLKMAYEMRRFFDTAEAHQAYIFISTMVNSTKEELTVTEVGVDTVVILEKENSSEITYIFEQRTDAKKAKFEVNTTDSLFDKLVTKKVDDVIPWGKSKLSDVEKTVSVSKIMTKYQYAFLESIELLNGQFSDDENLKLEIGHGLESVKEFMEESFKQDRKWQEATENSYKLYKENQVPLCTIAFHMNINPIILWSKFTNDKSIGVNCSSGFEEETKEIFLHLTTNKVELCCDITAILAIHHLELGELIITMFGKLHISYSTIELVKNLQLEKLEDLKHSSFQIIERDGQQFRYEKTKEEKEATLKYLEELLSFFDKYCHEPLPVNLKLKGTVEEHKKKVEIYGHSFYDTLLIAQENDFVLLSDDYVFREINKNENQVKALGTADLIVYCKQYKKMFSRDLLNEKLVKLLLLNYKKIVVQEDVLYRAIEMDAFKVCHHFFEINANNYGDSLTKAFHFINRLLVQPISEEKKVKAIHEILDIQSSNLFSGIILRSFRYIAQQTSIQNERFFEILKDWSKSQTMPIKPEIQFEDFSKVDIRTGIITGIRRLPKSILFIEVIVDFGFDQLKSLFPIEKDTDVQALIGKKVCAVVNIEKLNKEDVVGECRILVLQDEFLDTTTVTYDQDGKGYQVK